MAAGQNGGGPASQTIFVVGGGIAGVTAALEAAEAGRDVVLLEREAALGGRVTKLNRYFPKLAIPPAAWRSITNASARIPACAS